MSITTLAEYQDAAIKTMNPALELPDIIANCAMGVADEYFELIEVLKMEPSNPEVKKAVHGELGDLMWYTGVMAQALGWPLRYLLTMYSLREDPAIAPDAVIADAIESFTIGTQLVVSVVKKYRYQGHPLAPESEEETQLRRGLGLIAATVAGVWPTYTTSMLRVLDANIEKLKERYPSGVFKAEDSINRKIDPTQTLSTTT